MKRWAARIVSAALLCAPLTAQSSGYHCGDDPPALIMEKGSPFPPRIQMRTRVLRRLRNACVPA
jgi:hypothetical protein